MKKRIKSIIRTAILLYIPVVCIMFLLGSTTYFHFGDPQYTCVSCHEMDEVHALWEKSAHSSLHCRSCHGGSLTLDIHAIESHLNRVVQHFTGETDKTIKLSERDVMNIHNSCRDCHPNTFKQWQEGAHSTTYAQIFLNPAHNKKEVPASDCLRCHGMFHEGSIENLITPLDKDGPWTLVDPAISQQATIPCLACHQVHSDESSISAAQFFDEREGLHFQADRLPKPDIFHNGNKVRTSTDSRQRVCVQCHAPDATHQSGTSDDKTPTGVHEGLSCIDCHSPHQLSAKESCNSCHSVQTNCKLNVETMDTTFFNPASKHDIHTVSCKDCHGNDFNPSLLGSPKFPQ